MIFEYFVVFENLKLFFFGLFKFPIIKLTWILFFWEIGEIGMISMIKKKKKPRDFGKAIYEIRGKIGFFFFFSCFFFEIGM